MPEWFVLTGCWAVYRELGKQPIQITSPPSESEIEQYWGDILETEVCHNEAAFWLRRTDGETYRAAEQQWPPISGDEVTLYLKRIGNWKSSGPDQFMVSGSSASHVFTVT